MKQNITIEQWDDIEMIKKSNFFIGINQPIAVVDENSLPNIGQIIEFLGDDWLARLYWGKEYKNDKEHNNEPFYQNFMPIDNEICNQLWEAVKNKLK